MFRYDEFFDKGTIAGTFALVGLGVGIGLTSIIAKLFHDSEMDAEQRKRSLIPLNELTQNEGRDDHYNVIETYKTRLGPLYNVIQEQYGIDKRNEFENLIKTYAFPRATGEKDSKNQNLVSIPDLNDGLLRRNWLKGSGVDMAIMEIIELYKDAKNTEEYGMDVYMAMMQILQNIVIIYKEFLMDIKALPDHPAVTKEKKSGLEAVSFVMTTFVKELENTDMFRDTNFKLLKLKINRREQILFKLKGMLKKMGKEAAVFQKKITVVERSNEKFRKICNAASCFAQSIERMGNKRTYEKLKRLEDYTFYKRKDDVIYYTIDSKNNEDSLSDDLIAKIIIKHIRNAYSAFFSNNENICTSGFSYLNYLVNITNENAILNEDGNINLPGLAKVSLKTHKKFNTPLSEASLRILGPDIDKYFRLFFMAAAMQADLSMRIDRNGWSSISMSDEIQYMQNLINAFIAHTDKIAVKNILGEGSYFREFIERANESAVTNKARDEDKPIIDTPIFGLDKLTRGSNIIPADKDNLYGAELNQRFGIPLNRMLHAEAMKKASSELNDAETIDKYFSGLLINPEKRDSNSASTSFDNEFLYNIALACQNEEELKTAILNIESPLTGKKELDGYIRKLSELKANAREIMETFQFNNKTSLRDNFIIKDKNDTEYKIQCTLLDDFDYFMEGQFKNGTTFFEKRNGNYIAKDLHFSNKENLLEFKKSIEIHIKVIRELFSNDLRIEGYEKKSPQFLTTILEKYYKLLNEIDNLNKDISLDAVSLERIHRERQKIEFEQTINQMRATHELKTKDFINRIEIYQGTQKKIMDNLFSQNNQIFTGFIDNIRKYTDQYNTILTDAAINMESSVKSSFENIYQEVMQLKNTQESLYLVLDATSESSKANLESNEKCIDLNEKLLVRTDKLSTFLHFTIPDMISNILEKVNNTTKEMTESYQQKIITLTEEMEKAKEHELEFNNQKNESENSIKELNSQVVFLESEINKIQTELSTQKLGIQAVDTQLKSLAELAGQLSSIIEDEEYKITKKKVQSGIDHFLSKNIETLGEEYASNRSQFENDVNDILNNYHKIVSMVNIAEKCSTSIREKIYEIILLNNNINNNNSNVSTSINSINITLLEQKKSMAALENQITRLQALYDAARTSHLKSLTNQIEMMKIQDGKMAELNLALRESQNKYEQMVEKQILSLNEDIKSLKTENAELKTQTRELSTHNDKLNKTIIEVQSDLKHKTETLENTILDKDRDISNARLTILSEAATQFKAVTDEIMEASNKSFDNMTQLQTESKAEIEIINRDLDHASKDISNTSDIFRNLDYPVSKNNAGDKYSLAGFRISCVKLIDTLNNDHVKRLKKSKSGKQKWEWITAATNIFLQDNISSEAFLEPFKSVLIIYLQSRGFWKAKKTTIGRALIDEINLRENRNIRELLFGKKDTISYEKLSGRLLNEKDAIISANRIINKGNESPVSLTIRKFSPSKSQLTSNALKKTLDNAKLVREKQTLEKKIHRIQKTATSITDNINTKIKSLAPVKMMSGSSPLFSQINPFSSISIDNPGTDTGVKMIQVK